MKNRITQTLLSYTMCKPCKMKINLPTNTAREVSLQHLLRPSLVGKLTVTTHSINNFLPLYILPKTLMALQITNGV